MATLEFWKLSAVSDDQLLQDLSGLIAAGARLEARVVAHVAEVEERRLHLPAACSSLFDYCLRRMGLSESEAFHRITAARLARRFPLIFELLETRSIHLSALRVLRDHLTTDNHRELLAAASGKSTKEVQVLVAALAPRPDVAARIRKLPTPRRRELQSPSVVADGAVPVAAVCVATVGSPGAPSAIAMPPAAVPGAPAAIDVFAAATPFAALSTTYLTSAAGAPVGPLVPAPNGARSLALHGNLQPATAPRAPSAPCHEPLPSPIHERGGSPPTPMGRSPGARALEPLSSTRYLLRVCISHEVKGKLKQAQDLMSHANPSGELALVLEKALDLLLEKLATQRFAQVKRSRKPDNFAPTEVTVLAMPKAREAQAAGRAPVTPEAQAIQRRSGPPKTQVTPGPREAPARGARAPHREHISNEIRRAVAARDGWQCTYVDGEGRRCPSRAFLQFHHEHAHALGGPPTFENLRLLCGSHNRLLAERDFGRSHQERFTGRRAHD